MSSEEPIFVIKVAPANSPDVQSAEGAVDLNKHKKKGPSCQQQSDTYGKRQLLFVHFEK